MAEQTVAALPKAQFGEGGWLFLDNDANKSVGQYLGQVQLSARSAATWRVYFERVLALQNEVGFKFVQLFEPSTEIVDGH